MILKYFHISNTTQNNICMYIIHITKSIGLHATQDLNYLTDTDMWEVKANSIA
jgi:hypothetical protein